MIRLIVKVPGIEEEREHTFEQNMIKIGRLSENDVVLPGANISRQHCLITREEGEFFLIDNSSNGTRLNDRLVGCGNRLPLRNGDNIGLGDFQVKFNEVVSEPDFEKTTDYLQMKFAQLMAEPSAEPVYPSLLVVGGPTNGTRVELPNDLDEIILGRTPDCPVQVASPTVSKHHARIIRHADSIEVEDLGSSNGTFINGSRLTGVRPLSDRDEIVLGQRGEASPIRVVFSFPAAAAVSPPPPPPAEEAPAGDQPPTAPLPEPAAEAPDAEPVAETGPLPPEEPEAAPVPESAPADAPPEVPPDVAPPRDTTADTPVSPPRDTRPETPVTPPAEPTPTTTPVEELPLPEPVKAGLGLVEYLIIGAAGVAIVVVIVLLLLLLT